MKLKNESEKKLIALNYGEEVAKFKIYQQKRGVGIRFPLHSIQAMPYKEGMIIPEIEKVMEKTLFRTNDLMLVYDYRGLRFYEKNSFFANYEDASHQQKCQHQFHTLKNRKSWYKEEWQECVHCRKVEQISLNQNRT